MFPFSGEDGAKKRPCIVLAAWPFGAKTDVLVCMVTSQKTSDPNAIPFSPDDLEWGDLPRQSYIRPMYTFAGAEESFQKRGRLKAEAIAAVLQIVRQNLGKPLP